ncbi:MAG: DUF4142 domain-containing protein [Comamonadaceae bacterium]|nr:MAG: DUF4142 domain-containing protein [Comamonadaceae bacterium]
MTLSFSSTLSRRSPLRHRLCTALIACSVTAFAAPALAQASGTGNAASPAGAARQGGARNEVPRADAAFMKQAAENNHAEVESGRLAMEKASDPQIKAFARQMVEDHTAKGRELSALAAAKGVDLPDGPSMMQKGKLKLLSTADGANFDKRYAQTMGVVAHEDTVALFRKAASDARDPDVKAFAAKTLPALEHHLQMGRQLPGADEAKSGSKDKR